MGLYQEIHGSQKHILLKPKLEFMFQRGKVPAEFSSTSVAKPIVWFAVAEI
ncbi:hypothetical protein DAPPUDRAFT_326988 [Daphnia pulex]|uniref:Uncharacterized protein n=1 Tax=Daphnia pulex TaxID=6669 RepID=E9H9D5_DAPPU|nr:hypothetical protein DAPPUDRAFT_326988 [Daphnia pulex]|eukprot:EFX71675.1 hypothetical protein DAPPUDRAFT_326988 [Daphnia pulex]